MQKALETLATGLKAANKSIDEMLKLSHSPVNRPRIEKLGSLAGNYAKGAQQIAAVRSEAIGLRAAGAPADAAEKITKLNEEAIRMAREVTLPIAAELDSLTSQIEQFAHHRVEEETAEADTRNGFRRAHLADGRSLYGASADWKLAVFLCHHRPSDPRFDGRDGRTRRR